MAFLKKKTFIADEGGDDMNNADGGVAGDQESKKTSRSDHDDHFGGEQEEVASVLKKKKWDAEEFNVSPAKPLTSDSNTRSQHHDQLTAWFERDRLEAEMEKRKRTMTMRANLLGFSYIDKNKLYRKPNKVHFEDQPVCDCGDRGLDCSTSSCSNRAIQVECWPGRCGAGDKCQNRRFQKRNWVAVRLVKRGRMGYGAMADQPLKKGDFVMEYVGEVIDEDEKADRLSRPHARHHYTMALDRGEYLDPSRMGNFARFLNHSCDPNCVTQKWDVLGEPCMGFFAKRDIAKGEDLTFDYQFERTGKTAQRCLCGSANCRGWIGLKRDRKSMGGDDEDDDIPKSSSSKKASKTKKNRRDDGDKSEDGPGGHGRNDDDDDDDDDIDVSSIEEQTDSAKEPDDPLGLVEDGNSVGLWEDLTKRQRELLAAALDPSRFLVTADVIEPLIRTAIRDVEQARGNGRIRVPFLPRNVLSGFALFYRTMEIEVSPATIMNILSRPRPQVSPNNARGRCASWFPHIIDTPSSRRANVESVLSPLPVAPFLPPKDAAPSEVNNISSNDNVVNNSEPENKL